MPDLRELDLDLHGIAEIWRWLTAMPVPSTNAGLRAPAFGLRRHITDEERQVELSRLTLEINALRARAASVGADTLAYLLASAAAEARMR